jgi:hypothetical protein
MNRDDVVDSALDKINGDRQDEYGDVLNSFTTISIGWDTIVKSALGTHGCITPMHVGLMMDWLKTSRLLVDINHTDSWVDKVGYAALSAEVADRYMEPGELLDIRWGTGRVSPDDTLSDDWVDDFAGRVSPDVPPEGVVVEVEIEEEPPVWDGTIQDVETKKWVNEATKYAKEFAEREKKYLAEKGVLEVYKELLKIATLDELDAMAKYTPKPRPMTRKRLAAYLEPGLNALFGTEYEPYVGTKTCQKIDGRNGKPCGLPLVGRQKKFCSKHVPKSTKAARKAYGKRSKRQVNDQLS